MGEAYVQARTVSYLYDSEAEKQEMLELIVSAYDIQSMEEGHAGVKEVYEYLMEKNTDLQ